MSSNLFRTSIFITGALCLFILGTSVSQASRHHVPTICEGQSGKAFGICRAAVAAGCATNSEITNTRGRHHGHSRRHGGRSRYCNRLSRNFTRLTGLDPVWITPISSEPEPTATTTTDTTTTDTIGTTIDTGGSLVTAF